MSTIIRTSYSTHPVSGAARIVAKGAGKQRTVAFDHSRTMAENHGLAAGTLALVLGLSDSPDIGHDQNESGTKAGFSFPS